MDEKKNRICQKMKSFYTVMGIPLGIIDTRDQSCIPLPTPENYITLDYQLSQIYSLISLHNIPLKTPFITTITSSVHICVLRVDEDFIVVLGPIASPDTNLRKYMIYINEKYSSAVASHHIKVLVGAPRIDTYHFVNIAIHLTELLCDCAITAEDLLIHDTPTFNFSDIEHFITQHNISLQQLSFTSKLYDHIKHGDTNRLKVLLRNINASSYYFFQENGLEFIKFAFVFYASICSHYAALGGANEEDITKLLSKYMSNWQNTYGPNYYWNLLSKLYLEMCELVRRSKTIVYDSDIVNLSIHYIKKNLYSAMSIQDLCNHTHASEKTIARHFQKHLATTPAQYISDAKLAEATYLLTKTDINIIEISHLLHYSSQTHFNKNFKKKYGCTPKEYRHLYKQ